MNEQRKVRKPFKIEDLLALQRILPHFAVVKWLLSSSGEEVWGKWEYIGSFLLRIAEVVQSSSLWACCYSKSKIKNIPICRSIKWQVDFGMELLHPTITTCWFISIWSTAVKMKRALKDMVWTQHCRKLCSPVTVMKQYSPNFDYQYFSNLYQK